jgi:hypothetical protein
MRQREQRKGTSSCRVEGGRTPFENANLEGQVSRFSGVAGYGRGGPLPDFALRVWQDCGQSVASSSAMTWVEGELSWCFW